MNLYKNLNDIPFQFRQFESNENNTNEKANEENINIESNITKKDINAITESNIVKKDTNVFEKKTIQSLNSNCQMNKKDKLFILLILSIFFDVL